MDAPVGFALLGIGILLVLGIVFAISLRETPAPPRPNPPRGVHMPPPSYLPVLMAVGGGLIGAGLAFRPDEALVNVWLAVPGLAVFVIGIVAWVRAANREWREVEHGAHRAHGSADDAGGH
ncbi:MAG: hypothetical protein ACRDGJ_11795 [Candidatus Limnocylindria bacterium]